MKKPLLLLCSLIFMMPLFCNENKGVSINLKTDFAYYPESEPEYNGTRFVAPSALYDSILLRTTLNISKSIPLNLGDNVLLSSACIDFGSFFELSPVTVRPGLSVDFTPLPFLVLSTGSSVGTGWNIDSIKGIGKLDAQWNESDTSQDCTYKNFTPFCNYYYDIWASLAFQFDTGAIIQGEWTHVIFYAKYKHIYSGLTGLDNEELYVWQTTEHQVNGSHYDFYALLGYKMPLKLAFAGLSFEAYGYYSSKDYPDEVKKYDCDFVNIEAGPVTQFVLSPKNTLGLSAMFINRRAYTSKYKKSSEQVTLDKEGTEWLFGYLGLSWTHTFR